MHLDDNSFENGENGEESQEDADDMDDAGSLHNTNGVHREFRSRPVVHTPVDPPLCDTCSLDEEGFFSLDCDGCRALLTAPQTTISHLFAILRQWTPQAQHALEVVVTQMLNNGAHVDDRDGLTDMTMLHYVSKAGTRGIGDVDQACRVTKLLLTNCADPYLRCRWTNMAAIHYATYFDVAPVISILLNATKAVDVDSPCSEFDHGSPLHIAARNLCVDTALRLLEYGADPLVRDIEGKTPRDWLPSLDSFSVESETSLLVAQFHKILSEAKCTNEMREVMYQQSSDEVDASSRILNASGVSIGDKVIIGGIKTGILRYCGQTRFATGMWAGIELDEPVGKNNGSVAGIRYFKCPPNYGIFAPLNKISKPGILLKRGISSVAAASGTNNQPITNSVRNLSTGKVNVHHVTAKVNTGLKSNRLSHADEGGDEGVGVGERVLVAGRRCGVVRFVGETQFSPGIWYGIELDKPVGKNDGSVNDVRYFQCDQNRGVFAPPSRIERLPHDSDHMDEDSPHYNQNGGRLLNQSSEDGTPGRVGPRPKVSRSGPVFNAGFNSHTSPLTSLSNNPLKLTVGMNVLCSGEIGTVRYIGMVEFAEGLWVGIELRQARGKHDGQVQGQRYFTCRQGHGIIVRPSRVTVRGINASKLVD